MTTFHPHQARTLTAGQLEDAAVQLEHDFVCIVREEIGMHEGLATIVAQALVRGLRRRNGGQELWIPAPDNTERDASIRREFIGTNVSEIMAKYGLSRSRVYAIAGKTTKPRETHIGISSAKSPVLPLETGQANA